jgi:hypothetical protein
MRVCGMPIKIHSFIQSHVEYARYMFVLNLIEHWVRVTLCLLTRLKATSQDIATL